MKPATPNTLNGVRGWLLLLAFIAGLGAFTQLIQLPAAVIEGNIQTILHTVILTVIASLALLSILLRKKIAKILYILFICAFPISGLLVRIFLLHESVNELIGTIIFIALVISLIVVYFMRSKRVRNTLINKLF
jgi:flagellin-like protein